MSASLARPGLSRATLQWLPVVAGAGAALGVAFYYSRSTKVLAESKSALTGDGSWTDFKLAKVQDINHNTKAFFFDLPSPEHTLGLHTAEAVLTKIEKDGKPVLRPYTPVSSPDTKGFFELVVKRYENGAMSSHMFNMKVSDTLSFKGPLPKYKWSPNLHSEIALLAGGTGITPMWQLLHTIATNPEDHTRVRLFYASNTPDDIIYKKEIDDLIKTRPDQLKVTYFVTEPTSQWKGEKGYISKEFLTKNLFKPSSDNVKVFVCGPPPFHNALSGSKVSPQDQGELTGALKELGFSKDQVYKF